MKVFTRYIPLLALATLAATGCQVQGNAKYTGGGTMRSAGGAQNAVISFNGDTCSGNENAKGRVNFRDASALDFANVGGVALTASITAAGICPEYDQVPPDGAPMDPDLYDCLCPGWPAVSGTYTSTNAAAPGTGKFRACLYDQRDGALASGDRNVLVDDLSLVGGPYEGYVNHGVMNGAFQVHACDKAGG